MDSLAKMTTLEDLVLDGTMITDAGLAKLKTLTKLKTLSVAGTGTTEAGVAELQKALPGAKISR